MSELFGIAYDGVRRLDGRAIGHKDVHLRNVLVSDDEPVLIDFEHAGATHPAYDLCRLQLYVIAACQSPALAGDDLVRALKLLWVNKLQLGEIERMMPVVAVNPILSLAFDAACTITSCCQRVVAEHAGDDLDWHSMMVVMTRLAFYKGIMDPSLAKAIFASLSGAILEKQWRPPRPIC
jgi:thiamine kinase-like enzyme